MRCGDSSKNGELGRAMSRAREAGDLPPLDWTPADRRERCVVDISNTRRRYAHGKDEVLFTCVVFVGPVTGGVAVFVAASVASAAAVVEVIVVIVVVTFLVAVAAAIVMLLLLYFYCSCSCC